MEKVFVKRGIGPIRFSYTKNGLIHRFATILGVDILVKASAFILLPVFLRLMKQDEFGLYSYLISIIQTFSLVLNFGLYIPLSKLYHTKTSPDARGELLFTITSTLIILILVFSVPVILFNLDIKIISFLFDNHIHYNQFRGLIWASLLISVFTFILTNFLYTSERIKEVKRYNLCRIILINVVSIIGLLLFKSNPVLIRLLFTYLIEFVLLILFGTTLVKQLNIHFNRALMLKSLKMGLPIMISAIFGIAVNFSDKFLLQHYGSLKDLSNYYLAFSFAGILSLIYASLQNVWLPVFLKEKDLETNFVKTKKLISKLFLFFFILSIFIWCLFFILISIRVIPIKYNSVLWVLPVLLITQILVSITSLFSNYFIYFEKTVVVSIAGLVISFISISLGLLLIPKWGT